MKQPHRRSFLVLASGILAESFARAQQSKVHRIGFLGPGLSPRSPPSTDAVEAFRRAGLDSFRQTMQRNGWIEGKNYVMDRRYDEGKPERYSELAAELVGLHPDVLISVQTPRVEWGGESGETGWGRVAL